MIDEEIVKNINKIDFDLKKRFDSVTIEEKPILDKFFFEIISTGNFNFNRNTVTEATSKVLIEKKDLSGDIINWKYSINPNQPNAEYIERTSSIGTIGLDIYETLSKKMVDAEYIESVQNQATLIKEVFETEGGKTTEEIIFEVLEQNNFNYLSYETKLDNGVSNSPYEKANLKLIILHEGIKVSERFKLQDELTNLNFVNYVNFRENQIEINYKF